jgi:TolA-binding protein
MYRQGLCFIEMGTDTDLESARVFLDDLIARYPASPEADKAKRKLEILE